MFRRPLPDEIEEARPSFTRGERIGSAIAHAAPLLVGVPLLPLLGGLVMALLPCPIVAYVISRAFRRRQSTWGAFQGMQATLIQMLLVALVFAAEVFGMATTSEAEAVVSTISQASLVGFVCAFLLFLYTLWGAWDCAWGYDFRYIFISNFVDRITAANLRRQERRRQRDNPPNPTNSPGGPDQPAR